jgi:hypothetical protein
MRQPSGVSAVLFLSRPVEQRLPTGTSLETASFAIAVTAPNKARMSKGYYRPQRYEAFAIIGTTTKLSSRATAGTRLAAALLRDCIAPGAQLAFGSRPMLSFGRAASEVS